MPTCCDETSEAETAAATPEKKNVRDVLVTTATIMPLYECIQRELTKRQNFKSRFWLKYIAGNRVPVSLSPFFCNVLPIPPPLCYLIVQHALPPASRFFQSRNALTRMYGSVRTYCMLDRMTKWIPAGGNGGTPESGMLFLFPFR